MSMATTVLKAEQYSVVNIKWKWDTDGDIKGEKCPLCNTDLRPKSTIEKIKWYDKKTKECRKNKEKCWLAKIEWHS